MLMAGNPEERLQFLKGPVEETAPAETPDTLYFSDWMQICISQQSINERIWYQKSLFMVS
jgi:hypothetical protein